MYLLYWGSDSGAGTPRSRERETARAFTALSPASQPSGQAKSVVATKEGRVLGVPLSPPAAAAYVPGAHAVHCARPRAG